MSCPMRQNHFALWSAALFSIPRWVNQPDGAFPILGNPGLPSLCIAITINLVLRNLKGTAAVRSIARSSIGCASLCVLVLSEFIFVGMKAFRVSSSLLSWAVPLLGVLETLSSALALTIWCFMMFMLADQHDGGSVKPFLQGLLIPVLMHQITYVLDNTATYHICTLLFMYFIFCYISRWLRSFNSSSCNPIFFLSGLLASVLSIYLSQGYCLEYGYWGGDFTFDISMLVLSAVGVVILFGYVSCRTLRSFFSIEEYPSIHVESDVSSTQRPVLLSDAGSEKLSNRERAVVDRLLTGMNTAEIAKEMNLSAGTVSTYRSRAYEKLGIHSIQELRSIARNSSESLRDSSASPDQHSCCVSFFRHRSVLLITTIAVPGLVVAIMHALSYFGDVSLPGGLTLYMVSNSFEWVAAIVFLSSGLALYTPKRSDFWRADVLLTFGALSYAALVSLYLPFNLMLFGGIVPFGPWQLLGVVALGLAVIVQFRELRFCLSEKNMFSHVALLLLSTEYLATGACHAILPVVVNSIVIWPLIQMVPFVICAGSMAILIWSHVTSNMQNLSFQQKALLKLHDVGIYGLQANLLVELSIGASIEEVCAKFNTTPNTVKSYQRRCFRKLGVNDLSEFALFLQDGMKETGSDNLHTHG